MSKANCWQAAGTLLTCLLNDDRIKLSSLGTGKVLMERVFENREHIARMLQIDLALIESVPSAQATAAENDDDPLVCAVCAEDASEDRPILKCDGIHKTEVGYHLVCLPPEYHLEEMPPSESEWLCPKCCASDLWVVKEIRGKCERSFNGKRVVHYLCHWQGYGTDEDTYEPLAHIPKEARAMTNAFNAKLRKEREKPLPDS